MKLTAEQTELLLDREGWLGFHEEDAKLRQRYWRAPRWTDGFTMYVPVYCVSDHKITAAARRAMRRTP